MNDLVRLQTWSVSNRLSRLVGSVGDTSIQSILLEEWIPFLDVPKESFGIGGRLKNKSFKKMSDDITAITQAEIDTLRGPNGELSEEKIKGFDNVSSKINEMKIDIAKINNSLENIQYSSETINEELRNFSD